MLKSQIGIILHFTCVVGLFFIHQHDTLMGVGRETGDANRPVDRDAPTFLPGWIFDDASGDDIA